MIVSVVGVNDISIEFHKRNPETFLIGPYRSQISPLHINDGISYLTLPYIIPRKSSAIVDLTFNTVTSLILNDFALKENKKLVSVLYYDRKVLVKSVGRGSCVRCLVEPGKQVSNYLLISALMLDSEVLFRTVLDSLASGKSYLLCGNDVEEFVVPITKGCRSCTGGDYEFLKGEYGEIISENCGKNSSAVFPIDDREVDISFIGETLRRSGILVLEESEDYISFCAEERKMFLFRNGRLMIQGSNSKEETEYLFRMYVGN